MSEWIQLPWDLIILKKEDIEEAKVFHDEKGFGILMQVKNSPARMHEWRFKSKKMAQKMFLEFHKRLLDE